LKRLVTILVWSAISAAFIGPGTVTTAAKAGCSFGFSLLWALLFSTIACLTLQEASARLTIVSGKPLARAMGRGVVSIGVVAAVVLGCAAYQAGNILGSVAGAGLMLDIPRWVLTLVIGVIAAVILFAGSPRIVARTLGLVVALMGVAFLTCAVKMEPSIGEIFKGSLVPSVPAGSGMLALGLVGTTVVPYNLFLGSGLAKGQRIEDARFGLAVAIPLGGLISMGVLVVGTAVEAPFSFDSLSETLGERLGGWTSLLFAFGLFAAGLSSAITAPLAAALSVRGIKQWKEGSWRYRSVWITVLVFGLGFGLADVKPVPAILLAQALNGVLLPLVAIFLWIAVNDRKLMGSQGLNGPFSNILMGFSVLVSLLLGTSGVIRAGYSTLEKPAPSETTLLACAGIFAALIAYPVIRRIIKS
jgi:Mn2+/Fe2+ NRAMP family transporter